MVRQNPKVNVNIYLLYLIDYCIKVSMVGLFILVNSYVDKVMGTTKDDTIQYYCLLFSLSDADKQKLFIQKRSKLLVMQKVRIIHVVFFCSKQLSGQVILTLSQHQAKSITNCPSQSIISQLWAKHLLSSMQALGPLYLYQKAGRGGDFFYL